MSQSQRALYQSTFFGETLAAAVHDLVANENPAELVSHERDPAAANKKVTEDEERGLISACLDDLEKGFKKAFSHLNGTNEAKCVVFG